MSERMISGPREALAIMAATLIAAPLERWCNDVEHGVMWLHWYPEGCVCHKCYPPRDEQ